MKWTGQSDASSIMRGYGGGGQRRQKAQDTGLMGGSKVQPGQDGQKQHRIHLEH